MRWEFGSRLRDYVFDGATDDNIGAIGNEVRAALERWEPRIDVRSVDVSPDGDHDGLLYIDISYVVKSTNDRRNLVFPFYTIPSHEAEV